MIIATSQDFAAIDCCGCLPAECGSARKECKSVKGVIYSEGFFDSSNTEWITYTEETITYTNETDADVTEYIHYTGYGQDIYVNSYASAFKGGTVGNCQSWLSPLSATCNAYGSYVMTDTGQPPWVITTSGVVVQPVADDCTSNYIDRTHTHSNPEVESPTYDTIVWNGGTGAYYLYDITEARTYADGLTFDEWVVGARDFVLAELDFDANAANPSCFTTSCSPRFKLPHRPTSLTTNVGPMEVTQSRYRLGVPYTAADMPRSIFEAQWDIYSFPHGWLDWKVAVDAYDAAVAAHAEWVIEHAAWVVAQAAYDVALAAYDVALAEWTAIYDAAWADYYFWHEIWEVYPEDFPEGEPQPPGEDDIPPEPIPPVSPGSEPEEPIVPADPGAWVDSVLNTCDDIGGPLFVSAEEWIWDGNMGAPNANPVIFAANPEQWSPWFTLPMPELPTPLSDAWDEAGVFKSDCVNRDILICNMMTKCYHSSSVGVAPTIHPPIYIPPVP